MAKIKKKSLSPDEVLILLDCYRHQFLGRDGIGILGTKFSCQSSDGKTSKFFSCLVRKGNIENYPGECRLYDRLKGLK